MAEEKSTQEIQETQDETAPRHLVVHVNEDGTVRNIVPYGLSYEHIKAIGNWLDWFATNRMNDAMLRKSLGSLALPESAGQKPRIVLPGEHHGALVPNHGDGRP